MNFSETDPKSRMDEFIEDIINRAIVDAGITVEAIEARLCFLETEEMRLCREVYRAKRAGKPRDIDDELMEIDFEDMNLYRYLYQVKRAHEWVSRKPKIIQVFHPVPVQITACPPTAVEPPVTAAISVPVPDVMPQSPEAPPLPGLTEPAPAETIPIPAVVLEPAPVIVKPRAIINPVPTEEPTEPVVVKPVTRKAKLPKPTVVRADMPDPAKANGRSLLYSDKIPKLDRQKDVVRFIIRNGPATQQELVKRLEIPQGSMGGILDHDWFEHQGGRINITNDARQAVADKKDE